jgi:hypothetical protein
MPQEELSSAARVLQPQALVEEEVMDRPFSRNGLLQDVFLWNVWVYDGKTLANTPAFNRPMHNNQETS